MTTINNAPPRESHTFRNTLIAGGIGAAICGGGDAMLQINPETIKKISTQGDNFVSQAVKKEKDELLKIAKSGKLDYKHLGKNALIGSAIFAGIYLVGKGIKNLFSKN